MIAYLTKSAACGILAHACQMGRLESVCGLEKARTRAKKMIPMGGRIIRGYYYIDFLLSKSSKAAWI